MTVSVFIDANVFYGARLRSLVLYLAQAQLFRVRWSDQVQAEWINTLLINRPDLKASDLEKTKRLMTVAIPDALVSGYDRFIEQVDLPDRNDRHVVAGAVAAKVDLILTFNERDFPTARLAPFHLKAAHPDTFLLSVLNASQTQFIDAVRNDFQHYRLPPLRFPEYLLSLEKAGLPQLAKALAPHVKSIERTSG